MCCFGTSLQMAIKGDKSIHLFIKYNKKIPHLDLIGKVSYYLTWKESVQWTLYVAANTLFVL